MSNRSRYLKVISDIRKERGEFCEACGKPATHGHHIIPVSETSICSELVYEPANIMILDDDCHALIHARAFIRNITDTWKGARVRRGQALNG
jgi:hypothetical protein